MANPVNDAARRFIAMGACLAAVAAMPARGQGYAPPAAEPRGGAERRTLEIRSVEGIGPRGRIRTPEYQSSMSAGRIAPREWARVAVIFDTAPEWIDEITVLYYVLLLNQQKGKQEYTLLKGSVSHADVARGRQHQSAMYLRPNTVERYGEIIGIAVEISHKGEIADSFNKVTKIPADAKDKEWWKNPNLTVRDGYLLNMAQTPFAFINYDDYEPVK